MDNYETPMMVFRNKTATDETGRQNPRWIKVDINAVAYIRSTLSEPPDGQLHPVGPAAVNVQHHLHLGI